MSSTTTASVGVPYARVDEKGRRVCPACGEAIAEEYDRTGEPTTNRYAAHYIENHEENDMAATEQDAPTGRMKVEDYVRGALRRAGEKVSELTPEQLQRAYDAPDTKAGLRGAALVKWVVEGLDLHAQQEEAKRQNAAAEAEQREAQRERSATVRKPGKREAAYPPEVRAAVKEVKELKGTNHGAPGPKQHAHVRAVVTERLSGEPPPAGIAEVAGVKSWKDLGRIGSGEAPREDLAALRPLAGEMGSDAFCKGRTLAAILYVWARAL